MAQLTGFSSETVLVIGGAGFLGQHVVRELHLRSDFKEIRVFDCKPFVKSLDYEETKKITSVVGDTTNVEQLHSALVGVGAVILTAGVVDVRVYPDVERLTKVNVTGTKNVVESCIDMSIPYLVYTSSIDTVVGFDNIIDGNEALPKPAELIYPEYGGSKREAEGIVNAAHGKSFMKSSAASTNSLSTITLRPNSMYGEMDPHFLTAMLKVAKGHGGTLPRIGNGSALYHSCYVGNTAWAHVRALYSLKYNSNVGGTSYFVTDDTPLKNFFDASAPFLASCGMKLSNYNIPYSVVYVLFWIMELVMKCIRPVYKINAETSLRSIIYVNRTYFYSRSLAGEKLNYKPMYSYDEALQHSMPYYKYLKL